jgi:hypothetical protein
MQKPTKIKHHYRPIAHLEPFAAADQKIWVYDRTGIAPFRQIPQNVGFTKLLYAPEIGPNPKNDAFEDWLERNIDTPSVRPLRQLISGVELTNVDKLRMSRFLGMQDMRTPRARDYLLRSYQAHLDHFYQSWTGDLSRVQGDILQSEKVLYTLPELRELVAEHHPEVEKPDWLDYIQGSVAVATGRIIHMRWQMVDAPEGLPFFTNDLGIVKFAGNVERPCPWRMGFSSSVSHWFVPLSPTRALALIPTTDERDFKITKRFVRAVNKRLVLDASRFVFSTDQHDFIQKWWTNSVDDPNPDISVIPPGFAEHQRRSE